MRAEGPEGLSTTSHQSFAEDCFNWSINSSAFLAYALGGRVGVSSQRASSGNESRSLTLEVSQLHGNGEDKEWEY